MSIIDAIRNDDYEIVGRVILTKNGELKVNFIKGIKLGGKYFEYRGKRFPPGVYYLIRIEGRDILVNERTLFILKGENKS